MVLNRLDHSHLSYFKILGRRVTVKVPDGHLMGRPLNIFKLRLKAIGEAPQKDKKMIFTRKKHGTEKEKHGKTEKAKP